MENLVIWMSYGFFSFYSAGSFIGFKDIHLKNVALIGLGLGCLREFSGRTPLALLMKFINK
jgi:hypothetical protein